MSRISIKSGFFDLEVVRTVEDGVPKDSAVGTIFGRVVCEIQRGVRRVTFVTECGVHNALAIRSGTTIRGQHVAELSSRIGRVAAKAFLESNEYRILADDVGNGVRRGRIGD